MAWSNEQRLKLAGSIAAAVSVGWLGCSALPWPEREFSSLPAVEDGYFDLRGVVHVHTNDSHDSPGTISEVVEAARSAGVEWVALTEHARPGGPPARGQIRGVLLIPGFELRAQGGSLLALGLESLPSNRRDLAAVVQETHRLGGAAFLAHLESTRLAEPTAYAELGVDGVELVNLHAAAKNAGYVELFLRGLFLPPAWSARPLLRTPTENFARWERLAGRCGIVAGTDTHARVRPLGPLGGSVDSYRRAFGLLTTHVWVRERTQKAILEALRAGRSYIAYEALGRVDAFRFVRTDGNRFQVRAPAPARLVLHCDGVEAAEVEGIAGEMKAPPDAAHCHAEAWRGDRLWIVTSRQPVAARDEGSCT